MANQKTTQGQTNKKAACACTKKLETFSESKKKNKEPFQKQE